MAHNVEVVANVKKNKTSFAIFGIAVIGFSLAGCKDPNDDLQVTNPTAPKQTKDFAATAAAGVKKDISKSMDPNRLKGIIAMTARFGHRNNPFALSSDEIAFDKSQFAERIVIEGGNFGELYDLPESKLPGEGIVVEQQPYRRLSGILIGDSVLAILEENGKSTIIRPGMLIPDTDWRVVSIDRDKAILRREGDRLPKEVEVRLEVGIPGSSGSTFSNGGGQGGPGGGPAGDGPSIGSGAASGGGGRASGAGAD